MFVPQIQGQNDVLVPGLTGTFIGVVLPGLFVGTCIDVPVPETASVTDPEEDVVCEPLSIVGAIVGAIVGCVTSDVLVFPVPGASVVIVPASVLLVPDIAWINRNQSNGQKQKAISL